MSFCQFIFVIDQSFELYYCLLFEFFGDSSVYMFWGRNKEICSVRGIVAHHHALTVYLKSSWRIRSHFLCLLLFHSGLKVFSWKFYGKDSIFLVSNFHVFVFLDSIWALLLTCCKISCDLRFNANHLLSRDSLVKNYGLSIFVASWRFHEFISTYIWNKFSF